MLRQPISTADPGLEDRSMQVIEYALAFAAVLVAGVLAFIR